MIEISEPLVELLGHLEVASELFGSYFLKWIVTETTKRSPLDY